MNTYKTHPCRTPQMFTYAFLSLLVVFPLLLSPHHCYILQVVGYQNKTHYHAFSEDSADPNYLGPRPQIIDVPEYNYQNTEACPPGQKADVMGRCREVWPWHCRLLKWVNILEVLFYLKLHSRLKLNESNS